MRLILVFLARGWLVLELTNSPLMVGVVPATRGLSQIAFGAFSGVLLDRFDRRKMLVLAEWVTSITAATIGVLFVIGKIQLGHILLASAIEGVFMSIRWPALNTLLVDTVGSKHVLNATSSVLFGFNSGNILATAAGGLIIARWDVGVALLVASSFGILAALSAFGIPGRFKPQYTSGSAVIAPLLEGLTYILKKPGLVWIMALSFLMSLMGWSHISMMPVIARDVLGLEADGLGFLSTAGGIGALVATVLVASLRQETNKIRLALILGFATSVLLVMFAFSTNYLLSLGLRFALSGTLFGFEAALTAIVLFITAKRMQGRVQGVYSLLFGFTWFGGVVLGQLAEIYSAPVAVGIGGLSVGLATLLVWPAMSRIQFKTDEPAGDLPV
jgi:predicted MFS family arabinose efflux permease